MPRVLSLAVLFLAVLVIVGEGTDWGDLRLPKEHVPYFFRNNPDIKQKCQQDEKCPYKDHLDMSRCWGYEDTCPVSDRMSKPYCVEDGTKSYRRGKPTLEEKVEKFWQQADFGYVRERKDNMVAYCKPQIKGDSSLECVDKLKYCRGTNLYVDLRLAGIKQSTQRYDNNVLKAGQIGGHCLLDKTGLLEQSDGNKGTLSSWFPELQHFTSLQSRPLVNDKCDVIIDKPTMIIKPDSGVSLYHHFCDFVNLYISQHLNNSFSTDINILLWHTTMYDFYDLFEVMWKIFTDHPLQLLRHFDGKRVCFKHVIFSFLPRMEMGLFYTIRPIDNCYGSSMMRAFSQHTLHRLNVHQEGPLGEKLRVTFLSRNTKFRKITNEKKIISTLKSKKNLQVTLVDFNRKMSFVEQLKIAHNTDILIGIHGAGLTHLLFLPDWATVFEIHNCEDPQCYLNLARLRGVKYITWENPDLVQTVKVDNEDRGRGWAKFVDYTLDDRETLRLVQQAADHVTSHPAFLEARAQKYGINHRTKGEL